MTPYEPTALTIRLPSPSLVALIGPSGAGKSTFARRHFLPTEIVSSDDCRARLADDETDQTVTPQAFELLRTVAGMRLALGRLTAIDATSVRPEDRRDLVMLARKYHVPAVAVVLDMPEHVCQERNRDRPTRQFGPHVVRGQVSALRRGIRGLREEGFQHVWLFREPAEVDAARLERVPLWTDRRHESGPFDLVGDIHGCAGELEQLLGKLGYEPEELPGDADPFWGRASFRHPAGRRAVFLGDTVDRGPRNLDALRIVRNMVWSGAAFGVPGNHDVKLAKKLRGRDVSVKHGLALTLAEFDALPDELRPHAAKSAADFLEALISHFVLDGGALVAAHAGMRREFQGRASGTVRDFALYGETTGETDADGLPVRLDWARDYRGPAAVVYGHTPVSAPQWVNNTVCIDTGCVFGGALTALRWPEREFVSVPAAATYCEPARPLSAPAGALSAQQASDRVLDLDDVRGKRQIATRLKGAVTVRAEHAAAALEVMSRYAVDPRWLVYLPPTMSPPETSHRPGLLEHPAEAFAHFRAHGVAEVVCEEKHMGSRAVVVACRDAGAARERFGVDDGRLGSVYTRTGRPFFADASLEVAFLDRVRAAFAASGLWDELATGWAVLDAELMPWSAKAQELLKGQYAAVGAAGRASAPEAARQLEAAMARCGGDGWAELAGRLRDKADAVGLFVDAYRRYCWPSKGLSGLKLAPFHLLATEGGCHADKPHPWHLERLAKLADADGELLLATAHRPVDVGDPASEEAATAWWEELTARGGEGMVVKPTAFVATGPKGLVQPAVKVRGPEYLRIIYGPDYRADENLSRLRRRGLGRKRNLALSEFALGIEGLERFARREPLRRVHECAFAVLALESEPVDPRL